MARHRPLLLHAAALLAAVPLSAAVSTGVAQAAPQDALAPPRGLLGPGAGDAVGGGPGDRNESLIANSSTWTRWWVFNRDPYLARIRSPLSLPVSPAELGGPPLPVNPARPGDKVVHLEVVPTILERLRKTRDLDILSASLLALGKIGEAPPDLAKANGLPSYADVILERFSESNLFVRSHAVLALGLLEDPAHAPLLASIARDEKAGRKAVRGRRLDRRVRANAIYGLAHLGTTSSRRVERAVVVHHLLALADEEREDHDLLAAAVLGLGWNPLPFTGAAGEDAPLQGRDRQLALLHELFDDPRTDQRARTQIPVAIARLVVAPVTGLDADEVSDNLRRQEEQRVRAVRRLTEAIADRGGEKSAFVREGCVQALGLLVKDDAREPDRSAIDGLVRIADEGQDLEGGLSIVALARVVGRGIVKRGPRAAELRSKIGRIAAEGRPTRRPWALLATGIAEDRALAGGGAPALGTRALVELRLTEAPAPQERAAAAIGLGLSGAVDTAAKISERLRNGDFYVRGLRALSLAFLDAREYIPVLEIIVMERIYRPYLLRDVATALALFGAPGLADLLVNKLAFARFMPDRVAALSAMAWCDDPKAIDALTFMVVEKRMGSRSIDDTSRAFAITALGTLCGRSALPWNTRLALDVTWSAAPPTLTDPRVGGGVLDLL
ncbi:MAG: hypothetical protein AAGB93_25285 [Planctomycetota bacterium]